MSNREKILAAVKQNQPMVTPLPDLGYFEGGATGLPDKFAAVLSAIGGEVFYVNSYDEIAAFITKRHGTANRIVSPIPELALFYKKADMYLTDVHELQNVEAAIIKAHFGVAENGAVWVTEDNMGERALPFICQHLAVIIEAGAIVATMHEAYNRISKINYSYGTFIAGPSKTADIEQSLVIGAHGPRSMSVFVFNA